MYIKHAHLRADVEHLQTVRHARRQRLCQALVAPVAPAPPRHRRRGQGSASGRGSGEVVGGDGEGHLMAHPLTVHVHQCRGKQHRGSVGTKNGTQYR